MPETELGIQGIENEFKDALMLFAEGSAKSFLLFLLSLESPNPILTSSFELRIYSAETYMSHC